LDVAAIITGQHCTAGDFAKIVDQHVMVFGPSISVAHDTFEHLGDAFRLYDQARFLENFAGYALLQRFAGFKDASGQGPKAFERLASALSQQDAIGFEDQRSDP
jgi:hypothetical protein